MSADGGGVKTCYLANISVFNFKKKTLNDKKQVQTTEAERAQLTLQINSTMN